MAQMRRKKADVPPGLDNPLNYAVEKRDESTLSMVKEAIAHKQVVLAYQPVVSAQNYQTAAFYEGLLRVLDETGRVIPARDFMSAVENTEEGRQLDCLALEKGLNTLLHQQHLRLAINMSARSIGYGRWMSTLKRGLRKDPTIAERLILEVTESSAMQMPDIVIDFMDELQSYGIAFALDDFGAGFTSFTYFKDFFFDVLKVDGQFTKDIHRDSDNQILAGALVSIGRQFDMYTVAERVEQPEDAAYLASIGFDCLQGFLFGAPTISPPWKDKHKRTSAA